MKPFTMNKQKCKSFIINKNSWKEVQKFFTLNSFKKYKNMKHKICDNVECKQKVIT